MGRIYEDISIQGGVHQIIVDAAVSECVRCALAQNEGNQVWTAKYLGINRNTLRKLMKKYKISPDWRPENGANRNDV